MKKELKITIAVVAVLVVAVLIYVLSSQTKQPGTGTGTTTGTTDGVPDTMLETQTPEAAQATQDLVNEVVDNGAVVETINITPTTAEGEASASTTAIRAIAVSPGTSLINLDSGQVITSSGEAVDNDAMPTTQNAPSESYPITDTSALPQSTIKLEVTSTSFTPKEFTVNRGQVVSLAISNVNESTFSEVFRFDDPSLSAVAVGLAKGETKSISFNAPTTAGSYTFYSSMFDHRDTGAVGTMIVK